MTSKDLKRMESELQLKLPVEYRRWAQSLPQPEEEEESWQTAFSDADRLIEENRRLREEGWGGDPWHPHLVCIGEFDGGHFFIDLNQPGDVFLSEFEGNQYDPDDYTDCRVGTWPEFISGFEESEPEEELPGVAEEHRAEQIEKLMEEIADQSLDTACLIFAGTEEHAKEAAAKGIARVAGKKAPREFEQLFSELPSEVVTSAVWGELARSWSSLEPEEGIACARRRIPERGLRPVVHEIFGGWHQRDPSGAEFWRANLKDALLIATLK